MAKLPCYANQLTKAQWNSLVNPQLQAGMRQWIGNEIANGATLAEALDAANLNFFGGMAKPQFIEDLLPRKLTNPMRQAEFQQRLAAVGNQVAQQHFGRSTFSRIMQKILALPRAEKVIGHFGVFMSSHGGDLAFRPDAWSIYFRGQLRQVHSAASQATVERQLSYMERDPMYATLLKGGTEIGADLTAGGFLGGNLTGPSLRAWLGGLTIARFELAKKLMQRWGNPGPIQRLLTGAPAGVADLDALAQTMGELANHATGSAKGPIRSLGGNVLFGPSLTQSKVSRMTVDPVKTIGTFANWKNATYAERAVAWERLWGATQYFVSKYGALQINQGLLKATGSDQNVNFDDPLSSSNDFMQFKGGGMEARVGAGDPEIKLLASLIYTSLTPDKRILASKMHEDIIKQRTGISKRDVVGDLTKQYALGKLQPAIDLAITAFTREDFRGFQIGSPLTPLDTPAGKGVSFAEYGVSQLPIVASGPGKFVYDQLTGNGMTASDAMKTVRGLAITGAGLIGAHIKEERPPKVRAPAEKIRTGPPRPPSMPKKQKYSNPAIPLRY